MKKVEKHRTDRRRRNKMTVRAFCTCDTPYGCLQDCPPDDAAFYINMDELHGRMNRMSAAGI